MANEDQEEAESVPMMELQGSSRSSAEPEQDPQRVSVSGKTSRGVLHIVLLTCHVVRPVFDLIVGIQLYQ